MIILLGGNDFRSIFQFFHDVNFLLPDLILFLQPLL